MQRPERTVAEQLFQPRGFEHAVGTAERECRAGDAADRLANHVFRPAEGGDRFRSSPLRVAEPRRAVGDQPRRFEIGAHVGDMAPNVGMMGERLSVTFRLAGVHDSAQLIERGLRDAEIDRGIRAPEPVQIAMPERADVVSAAPL
jgi:hypothetical protein